MEQYWTPDKLIFETLEFCLENYPPTNIYIRDCGGYRENGKYDWAGKTKVRKKLENRTLYFKKDDSGLHMLVDSDEVFHFPLKDYHKGFSIAYERIDSEGRLIMLSGGIDPYDPNKPKPRQSTLRIILDAHLMEIDFEGRIELKFHSWWDKPYFKYWTVEKPKDLDK